MLKNRFLLANLTLNIVIIQVMLWALILRHSALPPQVPLWYNKAWGETQLTDPSNLWYLPATATAILVPHLLLGFLFYRREKLLTQLLIVFSNLVSLLCAVALWQILRLFW